LTDVFGDRFETAEWGVCDYAFYAFVNAFKINDLLITVLWIRLLDGLILLFSNKIIKQQSSYRPHTPAPYNKVPISPSRIKKPHNCLNILPLPIAIGSILPLTLTTASQIKHNQTIILRQVAQDTQGFHPVRTESMHINDADGGVVFGVEVVAHLIE
jgi:hypothetical protein